LRTALVTLHRALAPMVAVVPVLTVLVVLVGLTGPASAATPAGATVTLRGERPSLPAGVTRLGAEPGSRTVHLTVGLAGRDPAGLAAELAAVSTPGSPVYRHYLTSAEYAAAYGPSAAEVQQVSTTLRAEGLQVGVPTPGSTLLPVSGSAGTVSAAFRTPLESVLLPGNVASMVNTAGPQIPAVLAKDITGIVGLSGLAQEHSMLRRATTTPAVTTPAVTTPAVNGPVGQVVPALNGAPQACSGAASAAGTTDYTSTQLADDYGLSTLLAQGRTGIGETIGVVEFEQFSPADIAAFEACYGLNVPVRTVVVDGTPAGPVSGSGEAALDIELTAVTAPSASIVVYEAPNETDDSTALDLYNRIATDDVAQVVTTSWGFCEQENQPGAAVEESEIFQRMAVQGQTMVAAAGDSGSEDCFDGDLGTQLAVDDPGSQPDVLSGGGTTLTGGATLSQTAWNDCAGQALGSCQESSENGAGGGGYSAIWSRPAWQTATVAGAAALDRRSVPDLSLSADPQDGVVAYFGGWGLFGGTSEVPPSLAGFLADSDQGCNSSLGLVGPSLYAAYAADVGADFDAVTAGENDFTGTNGGDYPARSGDNLATGLGSPQEQNLAITLEGGDGCPSVAGLSAGSGPLTGAGAITLAGGGLADAEAVEFGSAGAGRILSESETSLTVVPPSPAKSLCVDVTVVNPDGTSALTPAGSYGFGGSSVCNGYRFVASDGGVFDFGSAQFYGSTGGIALNKPIVGMATTPSGNGYWLVASDGGIFTFGDAQFYGSTGAIHLNKPIVGMAATPDGGGYWLVASDGGIFAFGDAPFYGSTGAIHLNKPIVGMAPTPNGRGYWLVASDGGIFAFGDAPFFGSTGGITLNKPIVGMAATPDGGGYWLVASDGGIFTFGDAAFYGSTGGIALNKPIVGMAAAPDGAGYWLVAADGGIFTFGDAPFYGSTGGIRLDRPIVGMATG
jgi:Pro-kumamolisin, activation domain